MNMYLVYIYIHYLVLLYLVCIHIYIYNYIYNYIHILGTEVLGGSVLTKQGAARYPGLVLDRNFSLAMTIVAFLRKIRAAGNGKSHRKWATHILGQLHIN